MEATISPNPRLTTERRADCRYPIQSGLEYRLFLGSRVVLAGTGRLVNISRGGLLFACPHSIAPGSRIELEIDWPVHNVKMALHVAGLTVRSQGASTAVKILRSSFRVLEDANRPPTQA